LSGFTGGIADSLQVFNYFRGYAEPLFENLIGNPAEILGAQRKRFGVKLWVVNRESELQVVMIGTSEALLDVGIDAMRVSELVDTGTVVEAGGIENKCVIALPAAYRVSVKAGVGRALFGGSNVLGKLPPIHPNFTPLLLKGV